LWKEGRAGTKTPEAMGRSLNRHMTHRGALWGKNPRNRILKIRNRQIEQKMTQIWENQWEDATLSMGEGKGGVGGGKKENPRNWKGEERGKGKNEVFGGKRRGKAERK